MSKFEFLGINRQSISNFHVLLLQTEVISHFWYSQCLNEMLQVKNLSCLCFNSEFECLTLMHILTANPGNKTMIS